MAMCFGSLGLQNAASTSALFVSSSAMSLFSRSSSSTASILSSPVSRFSSSELQAITMPSISPFHSVVRRSEKVYFVRREQRVKGRGKEKKKDDVTSHQRKGSLPFPLSPSHSPIAFYSTSCKTVLLLPR